MFPFLPALILLLLGAPSDLQGSAWRAALLPELIDARRIAEIRSEGDLSDEELASILKSPAGSTFSEALFRYLVLEGFDLSTLPEPIQPPEKLETKQTERFETPDSTTRSGFITSQRSRDGPSSR